MSLRLCIWSGPRNVSTALMYSFAQRADTRVVDEPLYAHYLARSGAAHPGRDEVLAAQDANGARVVDEVILGPVDREVLFVKGMAHHLEGLEWGFLGETFNVLLVREPEAVLLSFSRNVAAPTVDDTGLPMQTRLLEHLRAAGQDPPVLDSRLLLQDPRRSLTHLCERAGLAFDPGMLGWDTGGRPEDGVWAPHWYGAVHRSNGFAPHRPRTGALPEHVAEAARAGRTHYDPLLREAERFLQP